MYKVGILGAENSHAAAFANIFNKSTDENGNRLYPDIQVIAVGGHYPDANKKVFEDYSLEFIAEKPEDMLGKIDALMVTARDGKYHAAFAEPFIKAGIPAFIDKPFCVSAAEALALVRLAKEKNVPLCGGSSVRFVDDVTFVKNAAAAAAGEIHGGTVTAPVNMDNEYSGFYFYSAHLVETALQIFGYNPVSVSAHRCKNDVTAILHYEDYDITCAFLDGVYTYSASVYAKSGLIHKAIDIGDCYKFECANFASMLRTGKQPHPSDELIRPVYVLNAIFESYNKNSITVSLDFPII